ncbi:hypothetical protein Y032_0455g1763 [Ancylostoma ceylanicum]|nr:hypothetical protein Y032_0455g1763 [Ancylostoma ceylanicum]
MILVKGFAFIIGLGRTNNPVIVDVNFYVRSISNIDFVRMEYNLQITFRQYWHDPRLEYSSMFGGKEVPDFLIITERDSIWTPDTFFLNEKRAHRHEIDKLNLMIRIHANGSVMYSERISLTLSCPMYIQLLSWSPRYKRQPKRTAEHGATRPPCNTAARLLRGDGLSIGSFFQAAPSALLLISARIFTFATHFGEFVVVDGTGN